MPCTDLTSYDFVIRQGFDKTVRFRAIGGGTPINLTGSVIRFNCSLDGFDQDATITNALAGEFDVVFPKAITADLTQRRVKYEVSRIIGDTNSPLFIGSINLTPEVA